METEPEVRASPPPTAARIGVATLRCDTCHRETPHRVLRIAGQGGRRPAVVRQGVARCQVCRTTHAFEVHPTRPVSIRFIRSTGPRSVTGIAPFEPGVELTVNDLAPGLLPPARIRKIELRDGRAVDAARSEAVACVWLVDETGPRVPVSLIHGASTVSHLLELREDDRLAVGGSIEIDRARWTIVALRARGHTYSRPGDEFPAPEVTRAYARRRVRPPAGSSPWSRLRETPSSRASSDSTRPRSLSSPGVTRKRTSPRRPSADGGATAQSSTPS
jgi:uncharacterized Zn finger protein